MSPSAPIFQRSKPLMRTRCPVPPRPGARADQCPVVLGIVTLPQHLVHDHPQIGERSHERLSYFRNCALPNRGSAPIDGERPIGCIEGGDAGRILAAPGGGVTLSEVQ